MAKQSLKRSVLGKDKKMALLDARRKAAESKKASGDKNWKRVISKMSEDKKKAYRAVGQSEAKNSIRGITRRSQQTNRSRRPDKIAYETTIHVAKLIKGKTFSRRAPNAIKKIRLFAQRLMKTKDNRIDASLNTAVWSRGIKGTQRRLRVLIQRKVAESTEKSGKRKHLYTIISAVNVPTTKGLTTKVHTA